MKNTLHLIALLLLSATCLPLHAQQQRRTGSVSFGAQIVQPLGDFALQYDGYPAGLAGTLTIPIKDSPFEFGFGYAWNSMGSQDEDVSILVSTDTAGDNIYQQGTMRIRNNINRYEGMMRFRPFTGMIQPYVDGIAGVEAFKTKTDITISNSGYSSDQNAQRQHLGMTYCYGWAAGLRVRLATNIFVEARFENLSGGLVQYVDQNSIETTDDGDITFDLKESRTNKYTYQLGIAIGF